MTHGNDCTGVVYIGPVSFLLCSHKAKQLKLDRSVCSRSDKSSPDRHFPAGLCVLKQITQCFHLPDCLVGCIVS